MADKPWGYSSIKLHSLFRLFSGKLLRQCEVKETKEKCGVYGVTWLDNKINVVCADSNRVHVLPCDGTLDELNEEAIKIKES